LVQLLEVMEEALRERRTGSTEHRCPDRNNDKPLKEMLYVQEVQLGTQANRMN